MLRGQGNAFVAKFNPAGSAFAYSTYLGGNGPDEVTAIDVDSTGFVYLTGAVSGDFPTTMDALQPRFGGGQIDAFVTKLSPNGQTLVYSSYLGGSDDDLGTGIAVNPLSPGFVYVTGWTQSRNFPTADALQPTNGGLNAFVTAIAPA